MHVQLELILVVKHTGFYDFIAPNFNNYFSNYSLNFMRWDCCFWAFLSQKRGWYAYNASEGQNTQKTHNRRNTGEQLRQIYFSYVNGIPYEAKITGHAKGKAGRLFLEAARAG